jgi:O-6-methylguanine DNA methyltransferase
LKQHLPPAPSSPEEGRIDIFMPTFTQKVIKIVSKIPKGKTLTYKQVAKKSGNEKAARAAGNILNKYYKDCVSNKKPTIACHRVIRSDGQLGGYAKGDKEKRKLLKNEGAIR